MIGRFVGALTGRAAVDFLTDLVSVLLGTAVIYAVSFLVLFLLGVSL